MGDIQDFIDSFGSTTITENTFEGFSDGKRIYMFKNLTGYDEEIDQFVDFNVKCNVWKVEYRFNFYFGGDVCKIKRVRYFYEYLYGQYTEFKFLKYFKFKFRVEDPMYKYLNKYGWFFYSKYGKLKMRFPNITLDMPGYVARKTKTVSEYNEVKASVDLVFDLYKRYKQRMDKQIANKQIAKQTD